MANCFNGISLIVSNSMAKRVATPIVSLHISYVPNGVANLGVANMETQRAHGQF